MASLTGSILASLLAQLSIAAPPVGLAPTSSATLLTMPDLTTQGGIAGGPVTLRVRGRFVFQRTVESSPATVGGARMRVEIWDEDAISDELMWETETDAQGYFDATFEWDDCDITGCDDPDLYVIVRAINDEQDIQHDSLLQNTWSWSTSGEVIDDVTATDIQLGSIQPLDPADHGAVHVHTVLALSRDALTPIGFPVFFPQLEVDWAPDATTTELDGTRLSLSGEDGWSEVVIAREHLLFVFEQKTDEPLASLCNGICDDDGCSYCLWCMEPPLAAWRVGAATWYGDALSRSMTLTTGAPPLTTVPEIDATFPCPDGLPSNIHWVPGYVAALLRDLEDSVEVIDVDGDGNDDAPPETSCERDSLARGLSETVERLFVGAHDDVDEFVDYLWTTSLPKDALWRTLRRIGGDTWTAADSVAPIVLSAFSTTHPNGVGPTPFATLVVGGADTASGISGASVVWSPSLSASVDDIADVAAVAPGSVVVESSAIPYAGVLYLHIRLVDCVGNWSSTAIFGPLSVSDCDEDGLPDFCACGGCATLPGYCPPEVCGTVADCNGNLVPDACEIESGAADDCNGDGVPDDCQGDTNQFFPPFGTNEAMWNTASNWTLGAVPDASQIACLNLGAPSFVTRLQGSAASVLGFGCDHILDVQAMLQSATSSTAHRIDLNGGTLTGGGDLAVSDLRWTTGTVTRPPNTSPILTASSITTSGNFQKSLARDTIITQNLSHNAGQLALNNGSALEIAPFATATITTGASITWGSGSEPSLFNQGTFRKVAPGTSSIFWVPLLNDGTIEVAEGRLELPGGDSTSDVTIASGATLALQSGTFTFAASSTLSGGRLEVNGGTAIFGGDVDLDEYAIGVGSPTNTLQANVSFDVGDMSMSGGTIGGAGNLQTGTLTWNGGTMGGTGTVTADALTIGGLGQKNLQRSLTLTGDGESTSSNVGLSLGGALSIARGAELTLTDGAGFTWISGTQPGTLINHGTLVRSGSGVSIVSLVTLNNQGLIDIADGTMRMNGTGTHTGMVTGAGTLEVYGGGQSFAGSSALNVGQLTLTSGTLTTSGGFNPDALTISNGTLTIDSAGFSTTNAMTFTGGTLTGTAPLDVNGPLAWTGGTMSGTGSLVVDGPTTISGASSKILRRTLVANGSVSVAATNVGIDAGGELGIPSDAELSLAGGASLTWISGSTPGTLNVDGTLRKTGDAGTASISFATSTFDGPIAIDGGTLQIAAPFTASGAVSGAAGTELSLTGSAAQTFTTTAPATLASLRLAGSAVSFAALVSAQSITAVSGTTTFNAPLTVGTWTQQGGTVGGSGSVTVNGAMTFSNGTLNGGSATMDVFGPVTLTPLTSKSISRIFRTHGPTSWSGGSINIGGPGGNAQWRIMPTGSLDVSSPSTFTWATGLPGTFVNEGVVHTLAGSGTWLVNSIGFSNSGTLEIDGALLRLASAPSFVQSAGATIVHTGRELEHSGSVVFNGGTLTGGGLVDANVLVGAATVAPGDGIGTLSIEGTMTFNALSSLALSIASTEHDRIAVTGALTCAGDIAASLADGFVPSIGDSFVIATCTSRSGTFADVSAATPLPSDRRWAVQHNPTNVTLIIVPALPCAGDLDLDGTVGPVDLALLLGAWGTDGLPSGADLNEDGVVSAPDLAILLGAWGPCPTGMPSDFEGEGGVATANAPSDRTSGAGASPLESKRGGKRRSAGTGQSARASVVVSARSRVPGAEIVHGDFVLPEDAPLERTLVEWVEGDGETCMIDASLLVIEGTATLDGTIRIVLADGLTLDAGACLRILVAERIEGSPRVELVVGDESIDLAVEVGEHWIDVRAVESPLPAR
jgi:hypothetical protein